MDLQKCEDYYFDVDYELSSMRIKNSWFYDEIVPIIVRLMKEEKMENNYVIQKCR